jgi:hypothetical protein
MRACCPKIDVVSRPWGLDLGLGPGPLHLHPSGVGWSEVEPSYRSSAVEAACRAVTCREQLRVTRRKVKRHRVG